MIVYIATAACRGSGRPARLCRSMTRTPGRPARRTARLDAARRLAARAPAGCSVPGLDIAASRRSSQFPGGHSNLTYLVRFGGAEMVVRRPPFGPVPPTAHDMAREFRWLRRCIRSFRWRRGRTCSAKTRGHRLGLLHHGAPPRPRGARRGAAGAARSPGRHGGGSARRCGHARRSARHRRQRRSARRARQAGRLRRAPGARAGPSAGRDRSRRRCPRWMRSPTGCARICRPDPATPAVVHGDFKLDNVCSIPSISADRSRCSTGR